MSIVNFYIEKTAEGNLLKWVGNVKNRTSFVVLRSTDEINFEQLGELPNAEAVKGEAFEFLDRNAPSKRTFYQVQYREGEVVLENSDTLTVGEAKGFDLKTFLIRLGVFLVLVALAVVLVKNLSQKTPPPPRPPLTQRTQYVKTQTVEYKDFNTKVEALGQVITTQPIDIFSEVSGRIERGDVMLKKAIRFGKGAVLFSIDATEATLNLKAQRSNFQNAVALILPEMKLDFPNSFETWQNYFNKIDINTSLPPLPEPSNQREKTFLASRNLAGQFFNIKSQEERLTKYRTVAPYSGIIQDVFTDAGSIASPATRILRIRKTDDLELEIPIRKEDMNWVKVGANVKILSEDKRKMTSGSITRIGTSIDPQTQSVNVYASVSAKGFTLYEGMYLYAELAGSKIPSAMEVSRNAIFDESNVFVVRDSVLYAKRINVHKLNTETALISGLDAGETIAAETFLGAVEGIKVIPIKE